MKKRFYVILMLCVAAVALSFAAGLPGATYAWFTDKTTAAGATAKAGWLQADVALSHVNWGVPSDEFTQNPGPGTNPVPWYPSVTVTNNGSASVGSYSLTLTIDKDTVPLLDMSTTGFEKYIRLYRVARGVTPAEILPIVDNTTDADGNVTVTFLVNNLTTPLTAGNSDTLYFTVKFKGTDLAEGYNDTTNQSVVDGNNYQGKPINITAQAIVYQLGEEVSN